MIESNSFSLIDSNILIYAYDKSETIKNAIAEKILEDIFTNKKNAAVSTQNLSEFFVNITNKIEKPISIIEAYYVIQEIISMSNVKTLIIEKQTIPNAIDISSEFNTSYWDSLIVSVMQENNIHTIITENEQDFKKIPWLEVINPFK
ncbi:PIN domain-containing protein [Candidatus Woesearchaeota archaeon]|nr:PIN domain-containing protein [Candidatus Woesearchaeota archaeon]